MEHTDAVQMLFIFILVYQLANQSAFFSREKALPEYLNNYLVLI